MKSEKRTRSDERDSKKMLYAIRRVLLIGEFTEYFRLSFW